MSTHGSDSRRLMWIVIAGAAVALAVAGTLIGVLRAQRDDRSTQTGGLTVGQLQSAQASQAALPQCAAVFVAGQPIAIEGANVACHDPDGTTVYVTGFRCDDGRMLWPVDASTGAPAGWGFTGQAYHRSSGKVAEDPAYARAYADCG